MNVRVKSKVITLRQITQLKLRNLKLYFMKSNISTFSDFKLYLFSTAIFATLKTRSEIFLKSRNRSGAGQIYRYRTGTGTGPNSTGTYNHGQSYPFFGNNKKNNYTELRELT